MRLVDIGFMIVLVVDWHVGLIDVQLLLMFSGVVNNKYGLLCYNVIINTQTSA